MATTCWFLELQTLNFHSWNPRSEPSVTFSCVLEITIQPWSPACGNSTFLILATVLSTIFFFLKIRTAFSLFTEYLCSPVSHGNFQDIISLSLQSPMYTSPMSSEDPSSFTSLPVSVGSDFRWSVVCSKNLTETPVLAMGSSEDL